MKKLLVCFLFISTVLLVTSCEETYFHEEKVFAGGLVVDATTLNKGRAIYQEYCMACHGVNGDGKGVAYKGMKVPPRDFTLGIYKFGNVISGELPHDQDFVTILKKGLHGTAMLPWDLTEGQAFAVVQYIKTFAPKAWEGKDKKLGEKIHVPKDPYGLAHKSAAIEEGRKIYHLQAECQSCHRGYVSQADYKAMYEKHNNEALDDFDPDFFKSKPQESEYDITTLPPDFTWDEVRSARTVEELFVRLAAGVGGTAMPSWKETITDDQIWAVAHYVRHLMDLKKSPAKRKALMESLKK
jgi:mono/diheme cytochrome c family protein